MATQLLKTGNTYEVPVQQFVVDTTAELADLPILFGNIALCLEDKTYYVCNSSGTYTAM